MQSINPLHWYVVEESENVKPNQLYKATIWNHHYVFWKTRDGQWSAMDDDCSHRGASLSRGTLVTDDHQSRGTLVTDDHRSRGTMKKSANSGSCVVCPYHGYEFRGSDGVLTKVPGLPKFQNTKCQNQATYPIVEKNGWVYINTKSEAITSLANQNVLGESIYEEPEAKNDSFQCTFLHKMFHAYARVVTENSLDVMHIGFVHTFGNRDKPAPLKEVPPHPVGNNPFHYRTEYVYQTGSGALAKVLYKNQVLHIQNEFVLPHYTIARVLFKPLHVENAQSVSPRVAPKGVNEYVNTIVTFASPVNITHTRLFIKTYRNFLYQKQEKGGNNIFLSLFNTIGDWFSKWRMDATIEEDRAIVENIEYSKADGKFNMRFDKLQNVYKTFYKALVHNNTKT
jgi:hypothetical protein